jgi:hypothetical protein
MRPTARPAAASAAVLLVAGLVLTGCSSDGTARTSTSGGTGRLAGLPAASTESASPRSAPPSATEGPFGPDGPGASDSPDPALTGQPVPTLPPGDPGTDGADADGTDETSSAHPPVTDVPDAALLDAETVGALAGGAWTEQAAGGGWCAAPRTVGSDVRRGRLLESDGGRLVETVSAYPAPGAAERAVARTAARLEACGWDGDRDPRLGTASEQLTRTGPDGTEQVALVLAADGVGIVLVAAGSAAAQGSWESLADLALGSSCLAAADGCH